ncbi:MAG: hypothetical protein CVU00_04455 [Bacteroidetes bacterium HGW-Bacteroidetes-17]|jgi:hypothetical protein|nr:MAG: hypothetical protein CVU00_04455 [Bacteroidetes bacterium HGW-Bacteroidetes-17]
MKKAYLSFSLLLISILSFGQFKIDAEIRPRIEMRNGYKMIVPKDTKAAMLISQRSRLGFSYSTKLYTTHLSFQDVRIWGEEQLKTNQINIGLNEAWVQFNVSPEVKIKVGRQVLKYDNERLIASSNWNQIGAKHDALKFSFTSGGWDFDFIGAVNQSKDVFYNSPYALFNKQYKNLGVFWIKKSWNNFTISSLNIVETLRQDNNSTVNHNRFTSGIIIHSKMNQTSIDARSFIQTGERNDGTNVDASLVNVELKQILDDKKFILGGFEIQSGNKNPDLITGKDKAFDILYGSRHKLNGLIDYFSGPSSTKGMGLVDAYLKYNALISKKVALNLDYHYFETPKSFQSEGLNYSSYLGSEIDFSCSITITPEINITNIFSVIIPTNSMAVAKSSDLDAVKNGFYFVTMLTFKPVFFKN